MKSQESVRIALWLPSDFPYMELALTAEIFKQINGILNEKKYSLGILKNNDRDILLSLAPSMNMPLWDWSQDFDCLFVLSDILPDKCPDIVVRQRLEELFVEYELPFIGVNTGILWLLDAGIYAAQPIVAHWEHWDEIGERYPDNPILPQLYSINDKISFCAGKMALADCLLEWISLRESTKNINVLADRLCIDRVRSADEKQRLPAMTLGGDDIQPRLTMAIELMEANLEEPLSTDEIADYVHISRRQLERLFKRYLNILPARYYLELRLKYAQHLLLTTGKSIVQIGLMCGFSSGPHFSSSYKSCYKITPRDERAKRFRKTT